MMNFILYDRRGDTHIEYLPQDIYHIWEKNNAKPTLLLSEEALPFVYKSLNEPLFIL